VSKKARSRSGCKARSRSRARSMSKASRRTRCAGARRSASPKGRKTKRGARSRSSSARGKSRARSTRRRAAAGGGRKKGRRNCYAAYLKAKLADKKLTKVRPRDYASVSSRGAPGSLDNGSPCRVRALGAAFQRGFGVNPQFCNFEVMS